MRISLTETKLRTYKPRDSWWTVVLVDPLAVRIVWLLAPFRWATPNFVTGVSFLFGIAAALAFLDGSRPGLVLGALLFYFAFVLDCVDGKIARLKGNGSEVGKWAEFVLDRIRFLLGAGALFYGQYQATQNLLYVWIGVLVMVLDLLHYLNGAEMRLSAAPPANADAPMSGTIGQAARKNSALHAIASFLEARRIRPRLFSGVEFEHFLCVIAPLTGFVIQVTVATVGLHLLFEAAVVAVFLRHARRTAIVPT